MIRRGATVDVIRKVLGDDYLSLRVANYRLEENVVEGGPCRVSVRLQNDENGEALTLEGEGVGPVDAMYHAFMANFAREFQSLTTIKFTGFSVRAEMESSQTEKGADAVAVVDLTVTNSEGRTFEFENKGRSLTAAALDATIEAAEYFVNSERAFISVYRALCDARERRRADLVQSFTTQLSELVKTTSYSQVIERIKQEEL
jgi:hypothetical protein